MVSGGGGVKPRIKQVTGKEKALLLFPLSKMCPQLATMRTYPLNVTSSRMAPPCDHPVETAPTFPTEFF